MKPRFKIIIRVRYQYTKCIVVNCRVDERNINGGSAKLCFHHELKVGSVFETQIYSTDTKNSRECPQNNIRDAINARCERHSINAWIPALPFMF